MRLGLANYEVQPEGDPANGRIIINLPATDDPERVKRLISTWGKLELVHVISPPSPSAVADVRDPRRSRRLVRFIRRRGETHRVLPYPERDEVNVLQQRKKWVVVKSPPIVTGSDLRNAAAVQTGGGDDNYSISFSLKPDGAEKFGAWTGSNINEYLGVVLNDEVKSIALHQVANLRSGRNHRPLYETIGRRSGVGFEGGRAAGAGETR